MHQFNPDTIPDINSRKFATRYILPRTGQQAIQITFRLLRDNSIALGSTCPGGPTGPLN